MRSDAWSLLEAHAGVDYAIRAEGREAPIVVLVVESPKACVQRAEAVWIVDVRTGFAWETVLEWSLERVDVCGQVVDFG
ncbi:MAG: hypothetical protein ACUVXJ_06850 [Phycisphaerae bacterium]